MAEPGDGDPVAQDRHVCDHRGLRGGGRSVAGLTQQRAGAGANAGPPPASSWATPPEFYLDENAATRSVRRRLEELGYTVHTPARLYGSREAAQGARDTDWLARAGRHRWAVIGRDAKIYERPAELDAHLRARVQVFLLPGEARLAELIRLSWLRCEDEAGIRRWRVKADPATTRLGHAPRSPHPHPRPQVTYQPKPGRRTQTGRRSPDVYP